jgi:two-component system, OmpR family, heavy metal sensor histidine kinase CusS
MRLTIRWRLTLWNTLALAAVLLGFGLLVYGLLRHALYEQVDRALLGEYDQFRQDDRPGDRPEERLLYRVHEFMEHEHFFCVIYDAQGRVYLKTEELAADSVPPASPPGPPEPRLRDMVLPGIGHQRALEGRLRLGGESFTVLHLAPLEEVDRELKTLLTALLTAGPLALVLSGGLAYLLAHKALAPVEQLHRMTAQITADRLDRRLPVANPGDELGHLAQTINAMIARLERSFAEVRRFTADASHELRTPLTAIRSEAEVALGKPLTAADYHNLLGSILEECGRLTRLTEQLLALAREDAGASPPAHEPLDLAALVEGVAETMRPLAEAKGLRLDVRGGDSLRMHGDSARLRQVFYNLLDNAIKYTPEGGRVEVCLGRRGEEAVITVRDTGAGIAPEHLPHVFDRFYRVDKARTRAEGGTGLGLSIAKSIVTAHEGRIELASAPGHGTTCTVSLPAGPWPRRPAKGEDLQDGSVPSPFGAKEVER